MFWPYSETSVSVDNPSTTSLSNSTEEYKLVDKISCLSLLDDAIERDASPSSSRGPCAVCGTGCRMRCGGCNEVYYCSKKHQQTHWSKHKPDCRPISIPTRYASNWKSSGPTTSQDQGHSAESKYMVVNKDVTGGKTLFSEKPLIICPNYPLESTASKSCICFGCYQQFPVDKKSSDQYLDICKRCMIPLCHKCLQLTESQSTASTHDKDLCSAIADGASKNRQLMLERNQHLGQSADLVKDFTILNLLMLQKSSKTKWEAVVNLKGNFRYQANLKNHTDVMKQWADADVEYFLAENYMKLGLKDKSFKLEDIVRIYAIFSDVAFANPSLRVLYELRSWIPHACSPNAEYHFKSYDSTHTLYLTAVEHITADNIVTVNYMPDYDEGKSKTAIRLFNKSRMICAVKNCYCKFPGTDASVESIKFFKCFGGSMNSLGRLRCSLFPSSVAKAELSLSSSSTCPGFMSPAIDPPNSDKPNLGMLIYIKSKNWNCSRCRKSEKFSTIQKIVKEINDKVKQEVETYCNCPDPLRFAKIKEILLKNVSEHHWLHWKVDEATLRCWDKLVGCGHEMLQKLMPLPPSNPRQNILAIVNLKFDLYGNTLNTRGNKNFTFLANQGILGLLERRHGRMSLIRATYLFDAFYANLIKFSEDFKFKLTQVVTNKSSLSDLISDTIGSWRVLINMLQETTSGLQRGDTPDLLKKATMVSGMHTVLQTAYLNSFKNRNSVIEYMLEYLEMYSCQDDQFRASILPKFQPQPDEIAKMFDPYSTSQYVDLTFGPINGQGQSSDNCGITSIQMPRLREDTPPFPKPSSNSTFKNRNEKKEEYSFPRSTWSDDLKLSETESDGDFEFNDDEDPFDVDLDDLFNVPMEYYEQLLSDSMRNRMETEKLLRDFMS